MFSTFVYVCGIIVIALAMITFISFLGITFTNSFIQFYQDSPKSEGMIKWNVRFNFLKSWAWQWMIYIFAFTSLCAGIMTVV